MMSKSLLAAILAALCAHQAYAQIAGIPTSKTVKPATYGTYSSSSYPPSYGSYGPGYPPRYGSGYPPTYGTYGTYGPTYPTRSVYPPAYPPSNTLRTVSPAPSPGPKANSTNTTGTTNSTVTAVDRCPGGPDYNPGSNITVVGQPATGGVVTFVPPPGAEGAFYFFCPVGPDCSLGMIFEVIVSPAPAGYKPKVTNLTWDLTHKYDTLNMFTGDKVVLTWTGFYGVSMMVLP